MFWNGALEQDLRGLNLFDIPPIFRKHVSLVLSVGDPFIIVVEYAESNILGGFESANEARFHAFGIRIFMRRQSVSALGHFLERDVFHQGSLWFHLLYDFFFGIGIARVTPPFVLCDELNEFAIVRRKDIVDPRQEGILVRVVVHGPLLR